MAEVTVNQVGLRPDGSLVRHEDGSSTMSQSRQQLCVSAVTELEVLARCLPGLVPPADDAGDFNAAHFAVRGVAARIERLALAIGEMVCDRVVELRQLEEKVYVGGHRDAL